MMVVAMEPARKRPSAVHLSAVGTDVGPLLEQGAMEALDLAVGLGPVGTAVLVDDAAVGQGLVEQPTPVAEAVVAQDTLDNHPAGPEPGFGPAPEGGRGGALLVGQDLGVSEAAEVVDGGVEVGVADTAAASAHAVAGLTADHSMPAAIGNTAQLLHVHVDQLAGAGALVAADGGGRAPVEVVEAVEVVTAQDPIDGGGGEVEVDGQTIRPDLLGPTLAADLGLDPLGDSGRRPPGTARAVMQALDSEFEIAMPPLRGTAPRDAHGGGHVGDRLAGLDALAQQQSTGRGERSVTVTQ